MFQCKGMFMNPNVDENVGIRDDTIGRIYEYINKYLLNNGI